MEQEWLQKVAVFQVTLSDNEVLQKQEAYLSVFETAQGGYYLEACEQENPVQVLFCTYLDKSEYSWNLKDHTVVGLLNTVALEQLQQTEWKGDDLEEAEFGEDKNTTTLEKRKERNFERAKQVFLQFENEAEATKLFSLVNRTSVLEKEPVECPKHYDSLGNVCGSDAVVSQEADWSRDEKDESYFERHTNAEDDLFLLKVEPEINRDYSDTAVSREDAEDLSVLVAEPNLSNLDTIEQSLRKASTDKKEQLINHLKENPSILEKFTYLFHICEDLKLLPKLKKLSDIIYSILTCGNSSMLELLLSDSYYCNIIGILEYRNCDISLQSQKGEERKVITRRVKLRKYLRKLANIEELITFHDTHVAERVRLNQRLMFLKQNFFPILSEDHVLTVLNSVMFFNNLDIINYFRSSPNSLVGLFETLKSLPVGEKGLTKEQKMYPSSILRFIYELCDLCKAQQQPNQQNRGQFFGIFQEDDLLSVCCKFLTHSSVFQDRYFCANIILILLNSFSSPVREYILKHVELFKAIVIALKREDDFALSCTLADVICMLIDPDTTKDFLQKDEFLDLFYEEIVTELLGTFDCLETAECLEERNNFYSNAPFGSSVVLAACQSCNILSHCVANHGYRPKYVIWRLHALNKACRLFAYHDSCISLYPLRLLRYCIGQRDEFYNRYIVKENIFGQVFHGAKNCANRKNIFYCALLELLTFIEKSGLTLLMQHIGKYHLEWLSSIFGNIPITHKYQTAVDDSKSFENNPSNKSESESFLGKRRNSEIDSEDRYFEENDEDNLNDVQTEWNVDRDLVLPQGNKDAGEESSVFLRLEQSKDSTVVSKVQKRRTPAVSLGKLGSTRPLVDYSWTEEEEPTHVE